MQLIIQIKNVTNIIPARCIYTFTFTYTLHLRGTVHLHIWYSYGVQRRLLGEATSIHMGNPFLHVRGTLASTLGTPTPTMYRTSTPDTYDAHTKRLLTKCLLYKTSPNKTSPRQNVSSTKRLLNKMSPVTKRLCNKTSPVTKNIV